MFYGSDFRPLSDDDAKYPTLYYYFSCGHAVIRDHREQKKCPAGCNSHKMDFFLIKKACKKCEAEVFLRYSLTDSDVVKHGMGGRHPGAVEVILY